MPIRIPGTKSSLTKAEVELPQLYICVLVIQVFVLMHPYKKYMHSRSGPRIHVTLSNNNNKINISGSNSNRVNDWANGLQLRSCVKTKLPTDVFFFTTDWYVYLYHWCHADVTTPNNISRWLFDRMWMKWGRWVFHPEFWLDFERQENSLSPFV